MGKGKKRRRADLKTFILFLCVSITLFTGCGPKKQENSTSFSKVTKEKELYLNHCANCHGGNLEGSFGPPLDKLNKKYTNNQILRIIQQGKGNMPAQDYISQKEQEDLAKWLSKN